MEVKPGYKKTEVGVIPEEWDVATATEACELVVDCKNRTPPVVTESDYAVVRTPNVRNGQFVLEDLRFTDEESYRVWTARAVPQFGDIMITREAPLGEVCSVPADRKVCLGQRMMLYRPSPARTSSTYLLYALTSQPVRANLFRKIGGSTVGHAKVDDIRFLQLPLPSLSEQRAIAEVLSDVDGLLGALDRLIAKKRDLKQAAMQQLLTGQTRLPGFHGEWDVKRIGEFTDCTAGGTPSTLVPSYWGGSIRWMNSGELNLKRVEEVAGRITEEGLHNSSTIMIPPKCVLIGLAGQGKTRGTVAMNFVELCTNQSIAAIFPNTAFVPEYLYYNLDTRYDELRDLSSGDGGRGGLNLALINSLRVPLPTIPEQTAIAEVLTDMDAELRALEQRHEKTRALKQAMMQELLTGKIRLV
jgi:type I restriction enzyme, S subunit